MFNLVANYQSAGIIEDIIDFDYVYITNSTDLKKYSLNGAYLGTSVDISSYGAVYPQQIKMDSRGYVYLAFQRPNDTTQREVRVYDKDLNFICNRTGAYYAVGGHGVDDFFFSVRNGSPYSNSATTTYIDKIDFSGNLIDSETIPNSLSGNYITFDELGEDIYVSGENRSNPSTSNSRIICYDKNLNIKWKTIINETIREVHLGIDGNLHTVSENSYLRINKSNGNILNFTDITSYISDIKTCIMGKDSIFYVGSQSSNLLKIDISDDSVSILKPNYSFPENTSTIDRDGNYTGYMSPNPNDRGIYNVDPSDGSNNWFILEHFRTVALPTPYIKYFT